MRYTVLIADDEELERDALSRLVAANAPGEPTILTAANGREVITLAASHRIDIALLDIRMPGLSGLEAAESLRAGSRDLALVFISAFDFFAYAQHALRLRAEDYLIKPVEDEAVLAVVGRWYDEVVLRQSQRRRTPGQGPELQTGGDRKTGDSRPAAAPSAVTAARFNEAIRFLERELLDDVIAGESDSGTIAQGLALLEITDRSGYGIIVKPRFDRYPLPLETDDQRRAVVARLVAILRHRLQSRDVRILLRSHPDAGYLIILGDSVRPRETTVRDWIAATGVVVEVAVSPVFNAPEEIGRALRRARSEMYRTSGTDRTDMIGEDRIREVLLHALTSGDPARLRAAGEEAWDHLSSGADRTRATALLIFLDGALRLRSGNPERHDSPSPATPSDPVRSREGFLARLEGTLGLLARPEDSDPLARRMRRWVEDNYHRNVGLPDIARALVLSESHCSREFTRLVGVPFNQHLRDRRLQEARRLLADTRLPVVAIAAQVGFRDANYLSRTFRRATGFAPAEWRRRIAT
jgi:two-component system response regulator YesN